MLRHNSLLAAVMLASAMLMAQAPRPASSAPRPILMDGHVHITDRVYWEGIDPWTPQPVGPFDYARAWQGGANVVIEDIAPYGFEDYNLTVKQVGRLIETFYRVLDAHRDKMELALSAADVRRIVASGKMAVLLGIEAGFDQDGDVDILRLWYRLGVRVIQFTSHRPTAYADAFVLGPERTPPKWGGINDRGRQLIAEMNRLGMLIDISHATDDSMRQIIEASRAPVVASHVGLRQVTPERPGITVPDDVARALAAKGGLIGITGIAASISPRYFDYIRKHPQPNGLFFLNPDPELIRSRGPANDYGTYMDALDANLRKKWRQGHAQPWRDAAEAEELAPTPDDWAGFVQRAVALVGPDHVGIGLDLFQGRNHLKGFDARDYHKLAEALAARKVPTEVLGENWLRVLDSSKAP